MKMIIRHFKIDTKVLHNAPYLGKNYSSKIIITMITKSAVIIFFFLAIWNLIETNLFEWIKNIITYLWSRNNQDFYSCVGM